MSEENQTIKPEELGNSTPTVETQIDLSNIKPIETQSVDLMKYDKKDVAIEKVEIMQVPTKYTELGTQWVLKIESEVLETIERTDETGKPDNIEFRSSELFNLIQSDTGELKGFPTGESSNLMKFAKDLGIKEPEKAESLKDLISMMVGKKVLIKAYEKEHQGNTRVYLKFRY